MSWDLFADSDGESRTQFIQTMMKLLLATEQEEDEEEEETRIV